MSETTDFQRRMSAEVRELLDRLGLTPAFTLATYVHLVPDDLPGADFLDGITVGVDSPSRENERDAEARRGSEAANA